MGAFPSAVMQNQGRQPDPYEAIGNALKLKQAMQVAPLQQQQAQQALQSGALDLQMKQQQVQDQQAATNAMKQWDGKDFNQLPSLILKNGGSASIVTATRKSLLDYQTGLTKLSTDQLANEKVKNDYFAQAIDNVKKLPAEQQPAAFEAAKADAVQRGHLDPQQAQSMQYQGPDQLDILEKSFMGHAAVIDQQLKSAEAGKNASQAAEASANVGKIQAEMNFYKAKGLAPGVPMEAQEAADWMSKNQGKSVSDFMKMKAGLTAQANASAQAGMLSEAARDMAAQNYAQTGQLPAGMRSPGMSASILNKAATGPTGVPNIAANKASYQADSASLKGLQKQFDQVTAFENTAGKNLDVFLNQAKNAVDSGSPWINKPLRSLDSSAMGSDDQAAFNAARTTALTEIAKVLNSSNASGVLSDSARHEVEGLIGPGATLKQIVSAATVLKQDMANRHQAYSDQINQIRNRASMGGSGENVPHGTSSGSVSVVAPNGKTYTFPDQDSADSFKKRAGIK